MNFKATFYKYWEIIKKSFINSYFYIKEFLLETYFIFINLKKTIIWLFIFIPVFLGTIINVFFIIIWYVVYSFKFLKRYFYRYIVKKNQKNLKIGKSIITTNNYVLSGIKNIFVEYPKRKSFLIMYIQYDTFFTFLKIKKNKNNKNILIYLEVFFTNIFVFLFRKIIFIVCNTPIIIIKNNNLITNIIYSILEMNAKNLEAYISTIILNICIQINQELFLKTYKLKIIYRKKEIIFNDKDLELLKKLVDINLWINGSRQLTKSGIVANMRYLGEGNKYLPHHPSIFFKNKNEYLVINQTTKKWLDILKEKEGYHEYKTKKELDHIVTALYKKSDAYIVPPHIIDKKYVDIGDSSKLVNTLNNPINLVKKFNFVQAFLIDLDTKLFQYDPVNKILTDSSYIKLKTYIINNFSSFDDSTKKGLEDLMKFYEKNKNFFENERLPFIALLYKAEINDNIKNYFIEIISQ